MGQESLIPALLQLEEELAVELTEDSTLLDRMPVEIDAATILHYAHPRRLDKTWCGASREPVAYRWGVGEAECVVCADLKVTFGADGWRQGLPA
jgi:hypothetical protein